MSVQSEVNRLSTAKHDLVEALTAQGVTPPSNTTLDALVALVFKIPSIKTGSFTMTQTAQTKSVGIGFKPTNVLVFYSESETTTSARGVFGWARTDLFSGVVDYIKTASTSRTTWSGFTIGNANDHLTFGSNGFSLSTVTQTSPILVGTYNWVAW